MPSHGFRGALTELAPYLRPWAPVVSLVKGLEQVTHRRMTEIIDEVLPGHPAGVLAGPNIAREVVAGYAAAAVIAMPDQHLAAQLGELFRTKLFRIYSTSDVVGVEIAGALKNVFAIAVGMGDGRRQRRQHQGDGDHPVAAGDDQARRAAGRRPGHLLRAWPGWAIWSSPAPARTAATGMSASSSAAGCRCRRSWPG